MVHQRPHEAGHPRPSVGIIGYKPCFSMNFWSAAAAGTISLSEKCSDDGRRDDMGLAGMRRLLPKLISLLFLFWEFSANEVLEFSARSAFFFWEFSANEVEFSARSASRLGEEVKKLPLPDTALSSLRPLASSISCVGGAGS